MRSFSAHVALLGGLVVASGCSTTVVVPDGVFACETVADCPESYTCVDMRCRAPVDGGPSSDGGLSSDGATDASATDASATDAS